MMDWLYYDLVNNVGHFGKSGGRPIYVKNYLGKKSAHAELQTVCGIMQKSQFGKNWDYTEMLAKEQSIFNR